MRMDVIGLTLTALTTSATVMAAAGLPCSSFIFTARQVTPDTCLTPFVDSTMRSRMQGSTMRLRRGTALKVILWKCPIGALELLGWAAHSSDFFQSLATAGTECWRKRPAMAQ